MEGEHASRFGLSPWPTCALCAVQVIHLGDMCISPLALDGLCRLASWQQQSAGFPNVCTMPQQSAGPAASHLLGKCLFSVAAQGSVDLTSELLQAARAAKGAYHARQVSL